MSASTLLASTAAGSLFGAALTTSGVYLPSVILAQMKFQEFHMLQVFLTASASSAVIMAILERIKVIQCNPRPPSKLGWLGTPYDGNIIGGALIGIGMTLTGACPGTVLVQIATGVKSGQYAIIGGLLGGILYAATAPYIRTQTKCQETCLTVPKKYNVNPTFAVLMFGAICTGVISVARKFGLPIEGRGLVEPIVGGLGIAGAQLATLLLTGAPVGVSTFYEDFGHWVCQKLGVEKVEVGKWLPGTKAVAFAMGIVGGSFAVAKGRPDLIRVDELVVDPVRGLLGGLVMVFGARLAGGCTSGHGISGMSMLGLSSLVSVAAMFGGGMALAQII